MSKLLLRQSGPKAATLHKNQNRRRREATHPNLRFIFAPQTDTMPSVRLALPARSMAKPEIELRAGRLRWRRSLVRGMAIAFPENRVSCPSTSLVRDEEACLAVRVEGPVVRDSPNTHRRPLLSRVRSVAAIRTFQGAAARRRFVLDKKVNALD
jgi:hypothetical protein